MAIRGPPRRRRRAARSWTRRSSPLSTRCRTPRMPTSRAASTLSSQSSTKTHSRGGRPSRSAASRKMAGSGLAMPTSAETTTSSKSPWRPSRSRRPRRDSIGVAQHGELVARAQPPDQLEVHGDGRLRAPPFVVERRERAARAPLELAMGALGPLREVADAPLDPVPGLGAVERLEHRGARQAVRAVELAGDVPAHVPQNAAEIEDDGATGLRNTCFSWLGCCWGLPCPCRS